MNPPQSFKSQKKAQQTNKQYIRFSPCMEMSRLTRDGTAEFVSRDQILWRERGQGNIHFPCSADHVQDWHPCPVDPYFCYRCDKQTRGIRQFCVSAYCFYMVRVDVVPCARRRR